MSQEVWKKQLAAVEEYIADGYRSSIADQTSMMNSVVVPCPPPKKMWFQFWIKQHDFQDITSSLNTMTYTVADRCSRCGLIVLGSGL